MVHFQAWNWYVTNNLGFKWKERHIVEEFSLSGASLQKGREGYLRQRHDEVVGVSFLGSSDHVFHCGVFSAIADVLCDGGGEEHRLLLHDSNLRSKPLNVKGADVVAVQSHLESVTTTSPVLDSLRVLNHNAVLSFTRGEKREWPTRL